MSMFILVPKHMAQYLFIKQIFKKKKFIRDKNVNEHHKRKMDIYQVSISTKAISRGKQKYSLDL